MESSICLRNRMELERLRSWSGRKRDGCGSSTLRARFAELQELRLKAARGAEGNVADFGRAATSLDEVNDRRNLRFAHQPLLMSPVIV